MTAHPATFTRSILETAAPYLDGLTVLDCFAGTGKVHQLAERLFDRAAWTVGVELEREWVVMGEGRTIQGDATCLPFRDGAVEACFTSPVYGNRMCFPAGTLVTTIKGQVPIEDVRLGDAVLTHRGRWRTVTWAGCTGEQPLVELTGQGARKLTCTRQHHIWTRPRVDLRPVVLGKPDWRPAELAVGNYWAVPAAAVLSPLPLTPPVKDRESFWWAVGFWLANGHTYHSVSEGGGWSRCTVTWSKDEALADGCEDQLRAAFGEKLRPGGKRDYPIRLWNVYSRELLEWLHYHFGKLAHGKIVPGWTLGLERDERRALVKGWLAGDGCTPTHRPERRVGASVNRGLIRGMQLLAHSVGMSTSVTHVKRAKVEMVCGRESQVRDCWHLSVTDYKTRRAHHLDGADWFVVREFRALDGVHDVYDLEVADDHSFVAEGVIVHNSDTYTDDSERHTYTAALGRPLSVNNSGAMQWGDGYRALHLAAWCEVRRVLKPGGLFLLNVSDHIRGGVRQPVCRWHQDTLSALGFELVEVVHIPTPRQRHGENGGARVECEELQVWRRP